MGKKKLLLWVVAVLMAGNAYAGEPKEPRLLKEIKFDREIKKFTDNIVVTDKELIFLDNDGNIKKKKELPERTRIEISKDGTRIGQFTAYDIGEKSPARTEFQMLDENGEVLWKTDKVRGEIHVSQANNGSVIEQECDEGGCGRKVIFYNEQNPNGKVIIPNVNLKARAKGGDISNDGGHFVATYDTYNEPTEVVLFDFNGTPLWEKHFENEDILEVTISPSSNIIAVHARPHLKSESHIYLFNKMGEEFFSQQVDYGEYSFRFDDLEEYMVASSKNGYLYLIDASIRKMLWKYDSTDRNVGFLNIDIASGFIAASVTTRNPKNSSDKSLPRHVYLFALDGKLLLKKKLIEHGFKLWREGPKIQIKESGKKIFVALPTKLLQFENEFTK